MYRDDEVAGRELIAALERERERVQRLEQRVRELEAENRRLASALAAAATDGVGLESIDFDGKLAHYLRRLIAATHGSPFADYVLAGALPIDQMRIAEHAKQLAGEAGRRYANVADLQAAARDVLTRQLIFREGVDGALVVDELLARIEP